MSDAENEVRDSEALAMRLIVAVKRLRSRLREESHMYPVFSGLSLSQISILQYLHQNGPTTAAALAVAEHVTQQAIAQAVAPLKADGLVETSPDPTDGRKTLIRLSDTGRTLRDSHIALRNAWLIRAINESLAPEDWPAMDRAIELMERLADTGR